MGSACSSVRLRSRPKPDKSYALDVLARGGGFALEIDFLVFNLGVGVDMLRYVSGEWRTMNI